MKSLFSLLIILLCCNEVSAQIFICVDENGRKHYSDKRCPVKKTSSNKNNSATINRFGKLEIPDAVKAYSVAIRVIKEGFSFLATREPENAEYVNIYRMVARAERRHLDFIANPSSDRFQSYQPFNRDDKKIIIASLSNACRIRGYFTICSTIEGNPWLSEEELRHLTDNWPRRSLDGSADSSCDKATTANTGGVISDKMMRYFCEKESNG